MFEAYVVYTFLLLFMLFSTWIYNLSRAKVRPYVLFLTMLVYGVVLGLRYNVGVDYLAYKQIYILQYFDDVEIGYALLNKFLYLLKAPYCAVFILVAFLQLLLFAKGVEHVNSKYLPLAIFFYFTTLYVFLSLNVLRQTFAFSIFVYSIKYLSDRKFIPYVLIILIAGLIHKSSFILIPLYFIINVNWFLERRLFQILVYVISYVLSVTFADILWNNFQTLAMIGGYGDYADDINAISDIQWSKEGGLGVYLWMLIDIWVISDYNKNRLIKINKCEVAFYNLYFIGIVFSNIVAGTYFDRINIYFQNMRIIIYSIFFYNIFMSKSPILKKMIALVIIIVLIIFFYMGISNKASMCAPYQFIFSNYVY